MEEEPAAAASDKTVAASTVPECDRAACGVCGAPVVELLGHQLSVVEPQETAAHKQCANCEDAVVSACKGTHRVLQWSVGGARGQTELIPTFWWPHSGGLSLYVALLLLLCGDEHFSTVQHW